MKYIKVLLILVVPFLLTGCTTVEYNLDIEKDLSVFESSFITATEKYFLVSYKELPKTVIKKIYDNEEYMGQLSNAGYTYEMVTNDVKYPGVLVQKKYTTLDEYVNNTIFKEEVFNNIICTYNDNNITLKMMGFTPFIEDETNENGSYVSTGSINIKLPYVVTSNNADNYDKKTNTYSWYIKEDTEEKEIELTFDKDKIYVYNLVMYISLSIIILLAIVGIIVLVLIVKKNKRNNLINE